MVIGRIKLRHLRAVFEIARRRSLSRAADALALTQPAVTKTLAELEAALGARLVERGRGGARLTPAGNAFLPRAIACLAELDAAVRSVDQAEAQRAWTAHVGALPTVAARLMPGAVHRFRAAAPEAVVQLSTGGTAALLDRLRAGGLDLVVGRLAAPERMADLAFVHLYSEPVRLVVRTGHPLADKPLDPSWLGAFPVILPDAEAVIRAAVERLLMALGASLPPDRIESVSPSFGRAFVQESDAVWIISEGVVARELAAGTLVALDI